MTRTRTWPTYRALSVAAGSIVVADNVKIPGAPMYRAAMREQQGKAWQTREHKTHGEYGSVFATWYWSRSTWPG